MSGMINIRRSTNGQNDQLGRKYLTDSITPWWGTWYRTGPGAPNIAFDNLPVGDALARIYYSLADGQAIGLEFNEPQNLTGKYIDFRYKWSTNDPRCIFYISSQPFASYTSGYLGIELNGDNLGPIVWTSKLLNPDTRPFGFAGGIGIKNPCAVISRVKSLVINGFSMGAPPNTLEISALTIRRL